MSDYTIHVGSRIRMYRKLAGLTLDALAEKMNKSRSTISKYELGQISMDLDTLIAMAHTLNIPLSCLTDFDEPGIAGSSIDNSFFCDGLLYLYWLIGSKTKGKIVPSVLEIKNNRKNAFLYMQFPDFKRFRDGKVVCIGDIHVSDHLTICSLQNPYNVTDHVFICAYTPLNAKQSKTLCEFSTITAPAAPICTKVLISKNILPEDDALRETLMFSKPEMDFLRKQNRVRIDPLPLEW